MDSDDTDAKLRFGQLLDGVVKIGRWRDLTNGSIILDAMSRAKIITVANLKGGVGKTTTSYALATAVSNRKRSAVVLDLDPGGGTYRSLAGNPKDGQATIADVLHGKVSLADALVASPLRTPGGITIYTVPYDGRLAQLGGAGQNMLRDAIEPIINDVHYVILDTHPSESDLRGPLEIADHIVIPTKLGNNDLNVSAQTVLLIRSITRGLSGLSGLLISDVKRPMNDEIKKAIKVLRSLKLVAQARNEDGEVEDVIIYYGKSWSAALNGGGRSLTDPGDLYTAEMALRAVETYHAPDASWAMFMSLLKGMPTTGAGSAG